MSDLGVVGATHMLVRQAGHFVEDDGRVSLSVEALAALMSQHNLNVVQQFMRLQRKAGIQTVRYADSEPSSVDWLVDRMADFDLVLEKDKAKAATLLREQVVDIWPVVDERLLLLCSQHRQLHDFGLESPKPL